MSEGNGILKISRAGTKKFAIGEGEPQMVDVSAAWDQWFVLSNSFADADKKIPADKLLDHNAAKRQFVCEMLRCEDVTMHEANVFIDMLAQEVEKLRNFFVLKSPVMHDSPANTEVRFSQ
jgi:hypothetical protein